MPRLAYCRQFETDWKGPTFTVVVSARNANRSFIFAKLDTGTSTTAVPRGALVKSGAIYVRPVEVTLATGEVKELELFRGNLRFMQLDWLLRDIEVVGLPNKSYGLIGLDILRKLRVTLNGSNEACDIEINSSTETAKT